MSRFKDHYISWRQNRINIIFKYLSKEFFNNKTILELGCGYGDIGKIFFDIGADVTCLDARQEHLDEIAKTYKLKTILMDLDNESFDFNNYDIIINFGILYHLKSKNVKYFLTKCLQKCNLMILESETLDSFENECIDVQENGYDQAFNNVGSHGSQSYIENIFREQNVNFKMIMDKELDSLSHIYSWNSINDKKYGPFKRRFWFVWNNNFNEFKL